MVLTYGTILATLFSTSLAIGGTSMAYSYGFRGIIMDPIGAGVCIALFGLFVRKLRRMRYCMISDLFRYRYGGGIKLISATVRVIAYMEWMYSLPVTFGTIFKGIPKCTLLDNP